MSGSPGGPEPTDGLSESAGESRQATQWLREPIHLHFLCNTLHLLQGLVHRDPDRVERMLDEMCELLAHLLHSTRVPDVPLRDEIAALQAYASLQRLRFPGRLEVAFDVDEALRDIRVPGFLIYPLLENAVKFGLETGPTPARVRVSVSSDSEGLRLEVANTGEWVKRDIESPGLRGHGLAVESVRDRLASLFPGRHRFTILQERGWVVARIELPAA